MLAARKRARLTIAHAVAILTSLIMVLPVYLVMVNALKTSGEAATLGIALPASPQWGNFLTAIEEGRLVTGFLNSLLYSTSATILGTLAAAMAAYVLSRRRTRLNRFFYFFLIMGIALPINFFTLTTVMQVTGMLNTRLGVILLYAAMQIPFAVFLIYAFIETVPTELDAAATIDGCSPWQTFFIVILPILTPVMVTAFILNFLGVWSDFLFPLYFLHDSDKWPMTLGIYNFTGRYTSEWNLISANIVLTILPVIAVYLLGQRFIVSGMTGGSVKG